MSRNTPQSDVCASPETPHRVCENQTSWPLAASKLTSSAAFALKPPLVSAQPYAFTALAKTKPGAPSRLLLFMLVNLWRFFPAITILAKLHIHRLSISDNFYLPGAPPPKRFEPIGYLIRLEFG